MMNTIKKYLWLLAIVMLVAPSCGDKEDVAGSDDYSFYLDIQTDVRLHLREAADEAESGMVNPTLDGLSRTVCYVKLLRCPLNPNGTANLNDAVTLKYYIFWREESGN